ncbi:MAG: hypothetical protein LBQ46_12875 [Treponema sp.]|nr:hypothetical protein [Treponema sp.]
MVAEFEMAALPLNDGVLALALAVLRTNKIIDNDWQTNMNTRLDSLLSSWIRETKNPDLVRTLYSKYEIKMTIFWGRSINPFRAFRRNLPLVHIIPHLNY